MPWIRRNLFFLAGLLLALGLLIAAVVFLLQKHGDDVAVDTALDEQWSQLKNFYSMDPFPNADNTKAAAQDQQRLAGFLSQVKKSFQPITPVNFAGDQGFKTELEKMVAQLNAEARAKNIPVPTNYYYTFQSQKTRITFKPGSLETWSRQLAEIQEICKIIFDAKVDMLEGLQRARVPDDEGGGGGGMPGGPGEGGGGSAGDYLNVPIMTNNVAIISPYRLSFRCFSAELADLVNGFLNSPHGFLVKAVKVESPEPLVVGGAPGTSQGTPGMEPPAPASEPPAPSADGAAAPPAPPSPGGRLQRRPSGAEPAAALGAVGKKDKGGLITVLNERPFRASILVYVITLKGGR